MSSSPQDIFIAADHGALELKNYLRDQLQSKIGLNIIDLGTDSDDSVDYPDFAEALVKEVLKDSSRLGILCCGTGIGISIKANRYKGIRAALVHDEFTAKMAKAHNNANVLCLGGRTHSPELALKLVTIWLEEAFEGGRHQRRLDKLDT